AGLAPHRQGHVRQAVDHRRHRGRAPAAVRRGRPRPATVSHVKLEWGPEEEAFRAELVSFLDEHAPTQARGRDFAVSDEEGIPEWARRWQPTLFHHGWLVPAYPPELA